MIVRSLLGDTLGVGRHLFNLENIPIKGTNYSHTGKIIFPAWEQNMPFKFAKIVFIHLFLPFEALFLYPIECDWDNTSDGITISHASDGNLIFIEGELDHSIRTGVFWLQ